jgi:hypothetical protein
MPDTIRPHDAGRLTAGELDRARRELHASLTLAGPDSPARMPNLRHLTGRGVATAESGEVTS